MLFLLIKFVLVAIILIFLFSWYRLRIALHKKNVPADDKPENYNVSYQTTNFGWYVPVKNAKAVAIVVHGYRDAKSDVICHVAYLQKAGYSTFYIDLRSDRDNHKSMLGITEYKDVEAAYDYMQSLPENKDIKIGFFGGSMGAVSSIIAAGKTGKGAFVIASVPYATFKRLFIKQLQVAHLPQWLLPFIRLAALFELGFDYEKLEPARLIAKITKPVFLISAVNDEAVNTHDAKYLYDRANEPKTFWRAESRHDIFAEHPKEYERRILQFLATIH
jgi:esterase/lipase